MFRSASLVAFTLLAVAYGQQVGTNTAETHPPLTWQQCTSSGCTDQSASVVLDSNWRWTHTTDGFTNCYTGNEWDTSLCPDGDTCAQTCALDGADYQGTYGITTSSDSLTLKFVTQGENTNVGSRVYLMAAGSENEYQIFNPLNQEFTFDVDVSGLPCGLNGALYFVEMSADGGMSAYPNNKAGAKYGTGYCDAQCPRDIKFIDGTANVDGWAPSDSDPNAGTGNTGTCCNEMDIWEANSISSAVTPHACTVEGQTSCTGDDCSAPGSTGGVCDQSGCDFNSYRMGDTSFYGPGMTVDTSSPFTVVTQFVTADNSSTGALSAIRRLYVQNGEVIQQSMSQIDGVTSTNEITADFCTEQKAAFGDTDTFTQKGGMDGMGAAFSRGMVLVMSIWDDHEAQMLWLDSNYPLDKDASEPGVARGTCATDSGAPDDVESASANAQVVFSNIRFGDIGTTFESSGAARRK
ncbi:cellobiohydrolase I-II [Dendrothele bispora CBS 962.96]|uniref:Glucanase n=1 Tax=Dendrothele bispora (strain CBS 962.96) TaxID=1314807 RepID=A0A4S8MPM5_DENBC|nr:cellobiohydrolase I-II [Dendrothele bispora CBS 962.96]